MLYFSKYKIVLILTVITFGLLLALPNFFSEKYKNIYPNWLPNEKINLGLDLQGGSHLLLEVDIDSVIKDRMDILADDLRVALNTESVNFEDIEVTNMSLNLLLSNSYDLQKIPEIINNISFPLQSNLGRDIDFSSTGELIVIAMTERGIQEKLSLVLEQTIEIVRRRIDELGTREPTIQRQGKNRVLVQLPGIEDPLRVKKLLGKTAKLSFKIVDTSIEITEADQNNMPSGLELLPSDDGTNLYYVVKRRTLVSGENLVDAQTGFDARTKEPIVSFRFDTLGAKKFGNVTKNNVGKSLAIILDERVISAPVVREPIMGGNGQISGNFTVESANDLAILLRAGSLPAPLIIVEERTVGPDLGADSIKSGKFASIIGLVSVVFFMLIIYRLFGLYANIALFVNLLLILGILSLLQATLTLPGIAGIVLTIGMAVDANVLIFERIKEELRSGKSLVNAVEFGYKKARTTILDANITTLISAMILFFIGSGPVKGFSVTLGIGIFTSVFTAFVLTRLMVAIWIRNFEVKKTLI